MAPSDPRGWFDRVIGGAFTLFFAALAVYLAVHLVLSVLGVLIMIGIVVLLVGVGAGIWRSRYRDW